MLTEEGGSAENATSGTASAIDVAEEAESVENVTNVQVFGIELIVVGASSVQIFVICCDFVESRSECEMSAMKVQLGHAEDWSVSCS